MSKREKTESQAPPDEAALNAMIEATALGAGVSTEIVHAALGQGLRRSAPAKTTSEPESKTTTKP